MLVADPRAAAAWHRFRAEFAEAGPDRRREMLRRRANQSRITDLEMIGRAGLGHVGGDMSVLDILTTLFFAVLRVDPEKPGRPDRDRFVLSKGHTAGALYTTLAAAGFFPAAELATFAAPMSALNGHPNRLKVPGVETNTGPLGHGLPIAVGMAVAGRLDASDRHVYVVLGDGELQEGSNWEAAMTAGHRRLANLTAVVDRNRLQQGARTEDTNALDPLDDKFRAFGWDVVRGRRPRPPGAAGRVHGGSRRPADLRHRQHDQGKGRLVHGGPGRMAPQGAEPRTDRRGVRGAGPMSVEVFDCRVAVLRGADRAGPRGRADRGGLQRLGGIQQPGRVRPRVPGPADQRGHRRAGHGRGSAPGWRSADTSRSSAARRRSSPGGRSSRSRRTSRTADRRSSCAG